MKKFIISAIILALLDIFTFYCFITLDSTNNLSKHPKKVYCIPIEKNDYDKKLYIYVNYDGLAEKTEEFYDESFDTEEEYLEHLNSTKGYIGTLDMFRIEEDEDSLSYRVIQTSKVNPPIAIGEAIYNLSKHECTYEEYY